MLTALVLAAPIVAAAGGGTVSNAAPTVDSFTNTGSSVNQGDTDVFSGVVRDRNKEADIASLKIESVSGVTVAAVERAVVSGDRSATTEPASFDGAGWKVWNPSGDADGTRLSFKYQFPYTTAGSYTWRLSVKDEGSYVSGTDIVVTVVEKINTLADPVSAAGATLTGTSWGAWTALPGATNVAGQNYIKVTNTGTNPTQSFTVSFTPTAFSNGGESIGIDGNIKFVYAEDTSPSTSAPNEIADASYTTSATDADGEITIAFTGTGNIIYVKYTLDAIPDPIVDQSYTAAYTVTAAN